MAAMEYCYYVLRSVPDFSLNKYASLSETGPSGVIAQHRAFWRQSNQWGVLFMEVSIFSISMIPAGSRERG